MKNLFSPLQLRGLTLKNRIVLSPMQQYSANNGIPGNWHLVHLGSRAVGGAGLILTECTAIAPEAMCTTADTGIWSPQQIDSWRTITDFVHAQDAKIGVQLWHAGAKASRRHPNEGMLPLSLNEGGWKAFSASATELNGHQPEAMSIAQIDLVCEQFAQAAKNAIEAGFDTIEIHAAHGYLLHQFYSSLFNKRTDEYGGSFENRIRLTIRVTDAVRKSIPQEVPLLLRLSAIDYSDAPEAWNMDDTLRLAQILKSHGVDVITASGGGLVQVPASVSKAGYQLPLATSIKKATEIHVGAVGMINSAQQANDIITNDLADLAVMAREHLRNPYFAINAAIELQQTQMLPWQYKRGFMN